MTFALLDLQSMYNPNYMSSQDRTYGFVRRIASGGMATVFEAILETESGFSRRVAIKQMHVERLANDTMRRMFFDEARTASFLHHGNIVQVLDYGFIDDEPILVMEYVDGIDASKATTIVSNVQPMIPEGVALHIIAEVAHALTYAHACRDPKGKALDIVHRDVSPQNVLLSWEGDVKLTDFGIALSQQRSERSETGTIKGKIRYMPPEQLRGEAVGPEADIYALGATLHALIAGEPPKVETDDILMGNAFTPELDDDLSDESRELVRRCMDLEPSCRLAADEVAGIAGRLSLMSLPREGRGALQAWLHEIRDARTSSAPLDDVMGQCFSPTWLERQNGSKVLIQTQTIERALPKDRGDCPQEAPTVPDKRQELPRSQGGFTEPAVAKDSTVTSVSMPIRPRRRSVLWLFFVFIVFAGLAVIAGLTLLDLDRASEPGGGTGTAAGQGLSNYSDLVGGERGSPEPSVLAQEQDASAVMMADGSSEVLSADSGLAEVHQVQSTTDDDGGSRSRRSGERRERSHRPNQEKRTDPVSPQKNHEEGHGVSSSARSGFIRVGGAQALNGVVRIDGRVMSRRAPAVFELPLGSHHVEVLDSTGSSVLLRRRVEVEGRHDRRSPIPVVLRRSSSP